MLQRDIVVKCDVCVELLQEVRYGPTKFIGEFCNGRVISSVTYDYQIPSVGYFLFNFYHVKCNVRSKFGLYFLIYLDQY